MRSLGVKGCTISWEAHNRDQQFGENETTDIGKSQSLRKEANARINTVSAMKPGLAEKINKVHISKYYASSGTDHYRAANGSYYDYVDTRLSKRVH